MWLHRLIGVIILTSTLFYGGYGYWKLTTIYHDGHAYLGLFVTATIFFLVMSGVVARSRLNRAEEDQRKMLAFKKAHKVSVIWLTGRGLHTS
jgi:NADH:ubiquinone oxidoreductase subunit H